MNYIRVNWKHTFSSEPTSIYIEVDDGGWEQRKVEVFPNGAMGYASKSRSAGGTGLSDERTSSLSEIAADPQFEPATISAEEFEELWRRATM